VGVVSPSTLVGSLWEIESDGSGLHPLLPEWKSGATHPDGDFDGTWIPSGKYFLFRSRRGTASTMWAIFEGRSWFSFFGRHPQQVYSGPLDFDPLAPSPDGKRIFFPNGQERHELVRYDRRRGQFMPFLSGIAARWVAFSPDGRWVAYTLTPANALWRCRPDGRERMQLTTAALRIRQPRWSPDGQSIAFYANAPGQTQSKAYVLPVLPSGGGALECITPAPFIDNEPSWSPNGKSLLYWRELPPGVAGQRGLYVMDWKTRKTELLPGSEVGLWRASWAPDGRYIAAINRAGSQVQLFDFRTRRWIMLAQGGAITLPHWSGDGRYIYYQDMSNSAEEPIFRVRIADRKVERMMDSRMIPQSNVTGYQIAGLAPGDEPIATVSRSNSDLYALDVELP
jgi:dipeptidyl aminopeptidase/acylaminoacyl peptidase